MSTSEPVATFRLNQPYRWLFRGANVAGWVFILVLTWSEFAIGRADLFVPFSVTIVIAVMVPVYLLSERLFLNGARLTVQPDGLTIRQWLHIASVQWRDIAEVRATTLRSSAPVYEQWLWRLIGVPLGTPYLELRLKGAMRSHFGPVQVPIPIMRNSKLFLRDPESAERAINSRLSAL